MSETLYTGLTLDLRRVPDYSSEEDANGNKVTVELPGFLELGVTLDGAWVTVQRFKAPGILADIERSKAATPASSGGDATPQPPAE